MKKETIKREDFGVLRAFVYEKTGIYFSDKKAYLLENRLKNRLHELNFTSVRDYYDYLLHGDGRNEELYSFFDVVTTKETSFFRHSSQLETFKMILQSEHLKGERRNDPLRVWSAGCSTGEEAYSAAIIILDLTENLRQHRPFTVYATDISRRALQSAERGVFNAYAVRHVDGRLREKYFTRIKNNYIIRESVKKWVKFDFMNLKDDDTYRRFGHMDVIFCRNVLIYFDDAMRKKVVEQLHASLKPGGYLFLGPSESLYPASEFFKPIVLAGAVLYQKERAGETCLNETCFRGEIHVRHGVCVQETRWTMN